MRNGQGATGGAKLDGSFAWGGSATVNASTLGDGDYRLHMVIDDGELTDLVSASFVIGSAVG